MNKTTEKIKKLLFAGRDPKGFNALPIFLNLAAYSGLTMEKDLGYKYEHFLFDYKNGFCEMSYFYDDLERVWREIHSRLIADSGYIRKSKDDYDKNILKIENETDKILEKDLVNFSDQELLNAAKIFANRIVESCSSAHMIEAVSYGLEKELRERLEIEISDKGELNRDFSILTAPTKLSFISQEERDLRQVASLNLAEQVKALEDHLRKYFWIQNSYAGAVVLLVDYFRDRLKSLSDKPAEATENKEKLIQSLKLSPETISIIETIDFTTIWQDERKAHILKAISRLDTVILILAERTGLGKAIYYLGTTELLGSDSIDELASHYNFLQERTSGVYFLLEDGREMAVSGKEYDNLKSRSEVLEESDVNEIKGWTAQTGKVSGRVVVCNNLASFAKVKDGDILVTAMTRPEFAPILKKVAAIVTDEGGITCHAAIVARELKIPCIIGTKKATKILQDGDLVEVDADEGVVKIIKRL